MRQPAGPDVEDLEPVVRRVDGEEPAAVGRQRQRSDLAALEGGEAGAGRACRNAAKREGGEGKGTETGSRHGYPRSRDGEPHLEGVLYGSGPPKCNDHGPIGPEDT